MFNSAKYWETRYKKKGTSGDGSYGYYAEFKAKIINEFIRDNNIQSIIDYGVGDGNQLDLINTQGKIYTGIDVSNTIIQKCIKKFENDNSKNFILNGNEINQSADLVISCDVIYHLIENDIYESYMKNMFKMASKYVIIYAYDEDFSNNLAKHNKFRKFTPYIKENFSEWKLVNHIPNIDLSTKIKNPNQNDFYIYMKV